MAKKENVIVILNYNDYENVKTFVNKTKSFSCIKEIVIVDNASCQKCQDDLKKLQGKKVTIIFNKENKGYGYGNNVGIRYVKGKYEHANIIISNPDIIVEENVVEKLTDLMEKEKIFMIAPFIKEENHIIKGWRISNIKDEIRLSLPHKNMEDILGYDDNYFKDSLTKVDVLSGCFFIVNSDCFVGDFFDENIFLYYEENVLAKRHKINKYVCKDVFVIHNHSKTINKNLNLYKKNKILKQSQLYYVENYCQYNALEMIILKILNKIVLLKSKTK